MIYIRAILVILHLIFPANKNRQIAVKPATVIKDISGSLHLVGGSNAAGDMLPVTVKKTYAKLR